MLYIYTYNHNTPFYVSVYTTCGLWIEKKDSFKYPNRYFVNVLIVPTITVDKNRFNKEREIYENDKTIPGVVMLKI